MFTSKMVTLVLQIAYQVSLKRLSKEQGKIVRGTNPTRQMLLFNIYDPTQNDQVALQCCTKHYVGHSDHAEKKHSSCHQRGSPMTHVLMVVR